MQAKLFTHEQMSSLFEIYSNWLKEMTGSTMQFKVVATSLTFNPNIYSYGGYSFMVTYTNK